MKDKSRFIGAIVLLLMILLILAGCPTGTSSTEGNTGTEDDSWPPSGSPPGGSPIPTPAQLASTLAYTLNRNFGANTVEVDSVNPAIVKVKNNFDVNSAITIPVGVTFSVPATKAVTVSG
ncbi:MAG: hypothetical protein LBB78_05750, partial [Spirochaetaceae bacterium]|nr:hypothetical protein [Spirochaetaceae bacterium]